MSGSAHHHKDHALSYHMLYDGQKLHWYGIHLEFAATSGLGQQAADGKDYNTAAEEGTKDAGPIPEGWYRIPLRDAGAAKVVAEDGSLSQADGVQSIQQEMTTKGGKVFDYQNWGTFRVPLQLIKLDERSIIQKLGHDGLKRCKKRGGFYIHSSHKGYTHGCVEVAASFFTKLRDYRAKHPKITHKIVRVHYADIHTDTYGGTWDGN